MLSTTGPLLDELHQPPPLRGPGLKQSEVLELQARRVTIEAEREACLAGIELSGWKLVRVQALS